jgi:hypothetical protein
MTKPSAETELRISYAIEDVPSATGINRRKLFQAIRDKKVCARKVGRNTIIEADELRRWIKSLGFRGRQPAIETATTG